MDWAEFIIMGAPNRDSKYNRFDCTSKVALRV